MGRKKKKTRRGASKPAKKQTEGPFNPALAAWSPSRADDHGDGPPSPEEEPAAPEETPNEEEVFLDAVSDVQPLSRGKGRVTGAPDTGLRPLHPAADDELEALTHLYDLLNGTTEMDITFSDEYIEGCVPGFSPKLMRKLKKGTFPAKDHIDLHGLTKREAEIHVREFLLESHQHGLRCVLVVHGRGLNSNNHIPVLKERLPVWLSRGPIKRIVLAFSTARPYDGGTGAIYVLLRKRG